MAGSFSGSFPSNTAITNKCYRNIRGCTPEDEKLQFIIIILFIENGNKIIFKNLLKALLSLGPETAFNKVKQDSSFCGMYLIKHQLNNHDIMHDIVTLSDSWKGTGQKLK